VIDGRSGISLGAISAIHYAALMTAPWNDWYHCNGNTYGTWLRGDPRGWRSRHHREHVDGDYKNPPTENFAPQFRKSQKLLVKPPVLLTKAQTRIAGAAMVQRMLAANIELLSLSLDDHHFHLVARFPDHQPKRFIGYAKQRAAHELVQRCELTAPVWAKGCRCLPVAARAHQVRSVNYDIEHGRDGAFVWTFRDPAPIGG
jgi:hypothetical protein